MMLRYYCLLSKYISTTKSSKICFRVYLRIQHATLVLAQYYATFIQHFLPCLSFYGEDSVLFFALHPFSPFAPAQVAVSIFFHSSPFAFPSFSA